MKKLKLLFGRMQTAMQNYVIPDSYTPQFGEDAGSVSYSEGLPAREAAFIGDMIWALDGPEQREAQAEADFDYLALSARTASGEFFGQYVNDSTFRTALLNFAAAAAELDRVKKLLFYGEDLAKGRRRDEPELGKFNAINSLGALSLSARTSDLEELSWGSPAFDRAVAIIHGVLGVATEGGEMVEALFKAINSETFDAVNMAEEIGDLQWYEAMLARALGTDFDTIQRANIDKLRKRYEHLFTTEAANVRDLDAERSVLEDDAYGFTVADAPTFDEEQTAASAELALEKAKRVKTQTVDFPDEMVSGVDPMPGKNSDSF